jgi:dihydroneopterin aldolase
MSLIIDVKGIKAYGKHGVYDEEKKEEQLFLIDVKLFLEDLIERDDSLHQTINYELIVKQAVDLVKNQSFNLIETLATKLMEEIQQLVIQENKSKIMMINVKGISVTVHKPETLLNQTTEDISVTVSEEF